MSFIIAFLKFIPFIRFTYTDCRYQKIYHRDFLAGIFYAAFISLLTKAPSFLLKRIVISLLFYALLILCITLIESISQKYLLGGGDCKVLAYFLLVYDFKFLVKTILLAHLLILLYYLKYKSKNKKSYLFHTENETLIIYLPFFSFSGFIFLVLQQFSA